MERFIRYKTAEKISWGIFGEDNIAEISGNPALGYEKTGNHYDLSQIILLAPVEPSKILCVGLNYRDHVKESQSATKVPESPVLFMKPPSALIGPGEKIIHPEMSKRVDYEAELAVIIGRTCFQVAEVEAEDYIFGYTCANDVTARDLQKSDGQWTRGKGFDSFCPVGPWVISDLAYGDLSIESYLNGDLKQSGRTSMMIFPVPFLVSFISKV
ncbi:MAG: fumarylacetoacetate hydrolase family protein, partial [candidate division Zixibacteria bacterium]|nr:fumarylacetoacetate hydrolase family protein [candidate division Zixibacteria bacterium]